MVWACAVKSKKCTYLVLSMSHVLKLYFATLLVLTEDALIREYTGTGIETIDNKTKCS